MDRARLVAEMMGDIVLQKSGDGVANKALEVKLERLDEVVDLAGKNDESQAWRMVETFSRVFLKTRNDSHLSAEEWRRVVGEYERFYERVAPRHRNDAVFRMMDLRFRYLARTGVMQPSIVENLPIRHSLEDSFQETDQVMSVATAGKDKRIVRNWAFVGRLISDYQKRPVPHMVNAMIIQLCADPGFI